MLPNFEEGVAYTSFLNNLRNGQFKFSLAEQKETTVAKPQRKVANFIPAIEICIEGTDTTKKVKVPADRNVG